MVLQVTQTIAVAFLALASSSVAQFPAAPVGVKVLESRFGEGVTISYKEVYVVQQHPCGW